MMMIFSIHYVGFYYFVATVTSDQKEPPAYFYLLAICRWL